MSTSDTQPDRRDSTLSALGKRRRRTLVGLLAERSKPISQTALSLQLAVRESNRSIDTLTSRQIERVERELHHRDLPMLESVALVDWDRPEETVRRTDHAVYRDPKFRAVLTEDADFWDDLLHNIADTRRRRLLGILYDAGERVPVDTAVTKLLAQEVSDGGDKTVSGDRVSSVRSELHHVHLPKLAAADLIEWNRGNETAEYVGQSDLNREWFSPRVTDSENSHDTDGVAGRNHSESLWVE